MTLILLFFACGGKPVDTAGSPVDTAVGDSGTSEDTNDSGDDSGGTIDRDCDREVPGDHATLDEAIAAAADGERICLAAGTWEGDVDLAGRAMMIVGAGRDATVLLGTGGGPVVRFGSAEPEGAGIESLTVTGGVADQGAGILVLEGAYPAIHDVRVADNTCAGVEETLRGVGVYAESGTFTDVVIEGSTCSLDMDGSTKIYGTGAYFRGEATVDGLEVRSNSGSAHDVTGAIVGKDIGEGVSRVTVTDNSAVAQVECVGAGLHLSGRTTLARWLDVRGNRCEGQTAAAGLSLFPEGVTLVIENVLVAGNEVSGTAGAYGAGLRAVGDVSISQADFVGNVVEGPVIAGAAVWLSNGTQSWRGVAVSGTQSDATTVHGESVTLDAAWCGLGADGTSSGDVAELGGEGILYVEPGYASLVGEPAEWDLSLAAGSAHIDAGDPAEVDVDGTRADIGAYGGPNGDWTP